MKVVLFCGGLGLRIRDVSGDIPKPMMPVNGSPILLKIMKYYAHWGHTEFILCLGYKGDVIREYFAARSERLSVSFEPHVVTSSLREGNQTWHVQLVETGMHASIGEDAPLPSMLDNLQKRGRIASFLCVRPTYTSHFVDFDPDDGLVHKLEDVRRQDIWINGGFFIFRRELFDYLHAGEDLVDGPFQRLIGDQQMLAYPYEGFWLPMDTFKDRQLIESLVQRGQRPWEVWQTAHQLVSVGSASQGTS
jgi:glucose-1-phosphate cytidylyltransferase